jgi:DNA-binding GntR family transcriptional regulator
MLETPMPGTWRPHRLQSEQSLVERTYEVLLDAICDGKLTPGARLTQEQLATLLGVSRQPITHALVLLKQQGFAREAPGRGLEVAPVEPDHLRAVYEARGAIEGLAAAAAARRATRDPQGCRALLGELEAVVREGQQAALVADQVALVRTDVRFHGLVAELSGNPVVCDIIRQQWAHIRRGIAVALEDPAFHRRCWTEHAAMLAAIQAGDADAAAAIAAHHCEVAGREVWERLASTAAPVAA